MKRRQVALGHFAKLLGTEYLLKQGSTWNAHLTKLMKRVYENAQRH
jgi:hypothetical protein